MAKKSTKSAVSTPATPAATPEVTVTPVRNSSVPPKSAGVAAPAAKKKAAPTREDVAVRAYLNWQQNGGSELENWTRAERELGL